ncbi:MAG: hypothetical protein P4L51_05120 [Puia sp.]|nr:hypothetical protein [Puia sp.]
MFTNLMFTKLQRLRSSLPFLLLFLLPCLQNCKKSGGSSGNAPGAGLDTAYYLTADINGKSWAANVNLQNGAAVLAGGSSTYIAVVGLQVVGKDSTALEMIFNKAANLNTESYFNPAYYNALAYGNSTTAYGTQPTVNNSDGSFVLTQLDGVKGIMAGTFNATIKTKDLSQILSVTNGKFKCPYDPNGIPSSPGGISIKE